MRPTPLRIRADLLDIIVDYAPSAACARAIREDRATILGGFTAPGGLPRVLVRVTSRHGRVWYIGVEIDEDQYQYRIVRPTQINWAQWCGQEAGHHPVFDGDEPQLYAQRRRNGHIDPPDTNPHS